MKRPYALSFFVGYIIFCINNPKYGGDMTDEKLEAQLNAVSNEIKKANNIFKESKYNLECLLKKKAELEGTPAPTDLNYTGKWIRLNDPNDSAKMPYFMYVEKDSGMLRKVYNGRFSYGHLLKGTTYFFAKGESLSKVEVRKDFSMFWSAIIQEIEKTEVLNYYNSFVGDLTNLINTLGGA